MIDLTNRSYQAELMDAEDIPFDVMAQTLKELNIVNSRLGGHAITIKGLKPFLGKENRITICEIGCGGGDNLFAIYKYCNQHHIMARFIGIDKSPECIAYAAQQYPELSCKWICNDFAATDFNGDLPDLIFSSLFCHHFTNEQLSWQLKWLWQNTRAGFFINDLHRHWLAYYLIKYITKAFSRSYLVKNDASLSVARSFKKKEWRQLFAGAGLTNYRITWQWAFRFLIIYRK
jgi:2-polyprenyl-3-methyl-5-hydroxy-6-metoxy-1,4-benzoquinol methylase